MTYMIRNKPKKPTPGEISRDYHAFENEINPNDIIMDWEYDIDGEVFERGRSEDSYHD